MSAMETVLVILGVLAYIALRGRFFVWSMDRFGIYPAIIGHGVVLSAFYGGLFLGLHLAK